MSAVDYDRFDEGYTLPDRTWRIGKRMQTIRDFAAKEGYADLRGFHWYMKRERLTYYDILDLESP